ncbi:MAG: DNA polymerase domain-containing protein [Syntrophothermus sp.]
MAHRSRLRGWLLDLYPDDTGLSLWLLGQDGKRHHLHQQFAARFFIAGPSPQLRSAWKWLLGQPEKPVLARQERRDLFSGLLPVLSVEVSQPLDLPCLFGRVSRIFPDLIYYDADIHPSLRHAAQHGTYPLADCGVEVDAQDHVSDIQVLSSPWDLNIPRPPLNIITMEPEVDPFHAEPRKVWIQTTRSRFSLDLEPARAFLIGLQAVLKRHDPDLILTGWGDTWLLPRILKMAKEARVEIRLNRDPDQSIKHRDARTYHAYGQVIHRGQQFHLAGRWHIDINNAVMYHDYSLEGIWELARVTALPVQTVARVSPGTGISSMQIVTALKEGILVPWHKQQAEDTKSVLDLIRSDLGGLVFQPIIGMHRDVAEIDFVSMYPSIMAHFNISPETIRPGRVDPDTGLPMTTREPGLIPRTLEPLLKKRIAIKSELLSLSKWDTRYKQYKAQSAAHKWLLVTCFGYLGYKNARFGKIEAHEAVTAYGREALLRAKEAAEDMGFTVLHMYVDGLWVHKEGLKKSPDFASLVNEIHERTGLPLALDGIYRWICFVPSRQNSKVPVANRYFGIFQSGEIKCRGIELRRHDTPAFIAELQQEALTILSRCPDEDSLPEYLDRIHALAARCMDDLRQGRIPPEKLLIRQTLSRAINEYKVPSPAAIAAGQLEKAGKFLRPGQIVRFIYTLGEPGVRAWDLVEAFNPKTINIPPYKTLLKRSMEMILKPFGVREESQSSIPVPLFMHRWPAR